MAIALDQSDPEFLLLLKKQESEALRDVLRSINQPKLRLDQLFKIAQNTFLAQLRVRKIAFYYQAESGFVAGFTWGFAKIPAETLLHFPQVLGVISDKEFEHENLKTAGIEYIVPLQFRNSVSAWIVAGGFTNPESRRAGELIFLETIGYVLTAAVENRELIEDLVQQETVRRELEVAEKIQQQLLLSDFRNIEGADVHAASFPHHKVGGDYYDVISRSGKGFFVVIADVAGKGIGAALLMANLQAQLRALILSEDTLSRVIVRLNENLKTITRGEQFVTLFIAHVRKDEGEMDFINAGHNHPVFVSGGIVKTLDTGTVPLGIMDFQHADQETLPVKAGDLLFLFTDGLVDQPDLKGNLYGENNVIRNVTNGSGKTAKEIVSEIREHYLEYSQDCEPADDVTMLAVKFA